MKHDAEDAIARLLRDRVEPGPPTGSCLDAETVAAWFDGTLTGAQHRDAESHASACARCQALLATMAQTEPVAAPSGRRLSLVRWFAPALVAATAVLVWINVARRATDVPAVPFDIAPASAPPATAPAQQRDAPKATLTSPTAAAPAPLEKSAAGAAPSETAKESRQASRKALDTPADALQRAVPTNEPETGAAAAPVPITADRQAQLKDEANRVQERSELAPRPATPPIVRSVDGSLWRIGRAGTVGHSNDNGTTWGEQSLGSPARLLAGSSPSPNVVWFGGVGGVVVVTTDGVSWRWRSLPERVDVTGIAAVDGQTATVTTRDGRRFVTHDGGLTWAPPPAQENPAAPF